MTSNLIFLIVGMLIAATFFGLCALGSGDDSSNDAQRIDFLEAHKATLLYNPARDEWAVMDAGKQIIGIAATARMAIELARAKVDADLPLVEMPA
jgi:hypothetical protein